MNENSQLLGANVPARIGSVIQIFATGQGASKLQPQVLLGSQAAEVLYSGANRGKLVIRL